MGRWRIDSRYGAENSGWKISAANWERKCKLAEERVLELEEELRVLKNEPVPPTQDEFSHMLSELLMCSKLSDWENNFVNDISRKRDSGVNLSEKQKATVIKIHKSKCKEKK